MMNELEAIQRWTKKPAAIRRELGADAPADCHRIRITAVEIPPQSCVSAKNLISEIAFQHGLTYADVVGPSRHSSVIPARFACYVALRNRGWSLPRIGAAMGGRDHTTVLYGLRQVEKQEASA